MTVHLRPHRHPLVSWLVVGIVALLLLPPVRGRAQTSPRVDVAHGGTLYARYCIACHGSGGEGAQGTGRTAGPPIDEVDAAYVDLVLRTGRMPLLDPDVGVHRDPDLDDRDRESLVAWTVQEFDLPDSRPPAPPSGDVAAGRELYARHCAACHGATGTGGVAGDGTVIRAVTDDDAVAVAEAIRVGPFTMPRFDEAILPDAGVADIATFVDSLDQQEATPLGLTETGQVLEALLAMVVAVVVLGIVVLVARPVDLSTSEEHRG